MSMAVFGDQYTYSIDKAMAATPACTKTVSWAYGTEEWVESPGEAAQGQEGLWMFSGP